MLSANHVRMNVVRLFESNWEGQHSVLTQKASDHDAIPLVMSFLRHVKEIRDRVPTVVGFIAMTIRTMDFVVKLLSARDLCCIKR